MGAVRFSCPSELVGRLSAAGGIDAAVETGTFRAEGTLALRSVVSRVWTIELSERLYSRAVGRYGRRAGITFLHGSSSEELQKLAATVDEPVIFWLDAHGGMVDGASDAVFNPAGDAPQCPIMAELNAVRRFRCAESSCVLIDDARAFLGPLPHHRGRDWPSLLELLDALRAGSNRHITILDDVVIAVPMVLRGIVDRWWLDQLEARAGRGGEEQKLWEAYNPSPRVAARRLVKSLIPKPVRRVYDRHR